MTVTIEAAALEIPKIQTERLSVSYGRTVAVDSISLSIMAKRILAIIGASGSGKSTFLRALNRMHDLQKEARVEGRVLLDGFDIYDPSVDPVALRRHIGIVFQRPNPFPKSIFENVVYARRIAGEHGRDRLFDVAEKALRSAFLWDEVKDRLHRPALQLSGGQQQRLCIARALAAGSEVLLMDEPTASLDPIATARIEDLIQQLKENYTIIIVTHSLQQAARISDRTAFMHVGRLIEEGETRGVFTSPKESKTEEYVTGRFG